MSESEEYRVGYRRPPVQTRFQKGRSGNPRGRRKGVRNVKTEMMQIVEAPVRVTRNGRPRNVPAVVAVLQIQMAHALQGDVRAVKAVFEIMDKYGLLDAAPSDTPSAVAAELAALRVYLERRGLDPNVILPATMAAEDGASKGDGAS